MKEKYFWVDILRVFAIGAVVLVHVSADIITEWSAVPRSWWWAANFYDSLARGAVPLFVMVSGALLLPKVESYRDFFGRRFQRIFVPFVAWTVFYLLWRKFFEEPQMGFAEALKRVTNGDVHFHLWFLYLIAGLYLITPLLRILTAQGSRRDLFYFLGLCFLIASLVPCWERLDTLFFHTGLLFRIPLEMAQGFIGYFILGFVLLRESKPSLLAGAGLFWLIAFLICFFGAGLVALRLNCFPMLVYDNTAPNVALYAASFFIIVKESTPWIETWLGTGLKQFILSLSGASFGIYLIHPVFIDLFSHGRWGFVLNAAMGHPAWSIPVVSAVIYVCSYLAVLGIQKIPLLKRTV
ncbi:MAG: acyltransferase family protein [Candidatus Omnitrophota bacterium]